MLRTVLQSLTVQAWWDAWVDFWAEKFPDEQTLADERARRFDQLDADLVSSGGGGNFDAAGTGGQD